MRISGFINYALTSCAAAAMLVGCGTLRQAQDDMQPPIGAPGAMPQRYSASPSYRVVYRFGREHTGDAPLAGLIEVGGTLYGTTINGGAPVRGPGDGTVYSITPKGVEGVLFSFGVRTGKDPGFGRLVDVKGTFYGTTEIGGTVGHGGVVYGVNSSGSETVLHSFTGGHSTDGQTPVGGLINVNGVLYGVTLSGGGKRISCGTVYSITTSGVEKVLYRFKGAPDGCGPNGELRDVGGTLYGQTGRGGIEQCKEYSQDVDCGTIFSITTSGVEKVLHQFAGGSDGEFPTGQMIDVGGTLYGVTTQGGSAGHGTVYSITPSGTEKVLYAFAGGSDGASPQSGLTNVNGTLYGTTRLGGSSSDGTVYSITTAGVESVLYSFAGGYDGMFPTAPLHLHDGTLYGTTARGGNSKCKNGGCGTVFALTP
jgi:uncharacterized repeat protein (TIGR03803 family)